MRLLRPRTAFVLVIAFCLPVLAGPKIFNIGAKLLRGKPTISADKTSGYYIWYDRDGLHLRFNAIREPRLYTGRIDTDKAIKGVTRVREKSGGWARAYGDRIVLFSATVRPGQTDGVDIAVPGAHRAALLLDIDGTPPVPQEVYLGEKQTNPSGLPMQLILR
ncbi:MAG TPA: hypothetical protein VM425_04035 [Myxococcota bacterium]|nr:hypothetical protein [Myxococcota bacterium]